MAADGSVIIDVEVDGSDADKEFSKLTQSAKKLEKEIYDNEQKRLPLQKQLDQLTVQADAAAAKLHEMQNAAVGTYSKEQIDAQSETVRALGARWDDVHKQLTKCDKKIQDATAKLSETKEKAGGVARSSNEAAKSVEKMGSATKKANKHMGSFALRVREVVRSALVFTLITKALGMFREWVGKVIKTSGEATAAVAKLKGSLLALAQPLVSVIIPAFTWLVNVLARLVSVVAQLLSYVFGKTAKQSANAAEALHKQTEALEGVGNAADDAAGSLAGFDEINTIQTEDAPSAAADEIKSDFSMDVEMSEGQLKRLLELVKLIGAALLTWKIGKGLKLGLKGALGLFVAIFGAIQFASGLIDAFSNGVSWDNLKTMIFGLTLAVIGFYVALGPTAAGIAAIVGGLAMLVLGFKDAFENGWNLQNLLSSVTGIIVAGLGISLLTGSFIPALIAGIAALVLAFTVAMGHGDEFIGGLKETFQGFVDFFKGVFTGDMELASGGIEKIFRGLGTAIGSVVDSFRDLFNKFFDWLDEKTGGKLSGIIGFMRGLFSGLFDFVDGVLGDIVDAGTKMLQGLLEFISGVFTGDWDKAWQGVKKVFSGIWNGIIGILEGAVNLVIKGINWLISQLNKISFTVPSWVPKIGGQSIGININPVREISIPRLATGAVIPPNREFLAVLGDQRSGNNIEAPEDLIRQIVREEAGGMNTELLQAILEAIKAGRVMTVDKKVLARTAAQGINDMTIESGKPVLIF